MPHAKKWSDDKSHKNHEVAILWNFTIHNGRYINDNRQYKTIKDDNKKKLPSHRMPC